MNYIPTDDGRWVSEHFERLARVIQDYDSAFALYWVPPEHRANPEDEKKCYAVIEEATNSVVFYAGVNDTPESILGRLFDSDNKHGNVLERLDAHNAAIRALQMKEQMDAAEERQEKIAWLIGTKKNYINLGNGRVVDDQLRPIRAGRRG